LAFRLNQPVLGGFSENNSPTSLARRDERAADDIQSRFNRFELGR
jgi:hypothetical protein